MYTVRTWSGSVSSAPAFSDFLTSTLSLPCPGSVSGSWIRNSWGVSRWKKLCRLSGYLLDSSTAVRSLAGGVGESVNGYAVLRMVYKPSLRTTGMVKSSSAAIVSSRPSLSSSFIKSWRLCCSSLSSNFCATRNIVGRRTPVPSLYEGLASANKGNTLGRCVGPSCLAILTRGPSKRLTRNALGEQSDRLDAGLSSSPSCGLAPSAPTPFRSTASRTAAICRLCGIRAALGRGERDGY